LRLNTVPKRTKERMIDMRVVRVERFGGPEVLAAADAPDPEPGPGESVVAVSAADVLFVETRIRAGEGADYFPVRPPYVPGHSADTVAPRRS
jgi:NADPH:quinone reductase